MYVYIYIYYIKYGCMYVVRYLHRFIAGSRWNRTSKIVCVSSCPHDLVTPNSRPSLLCTGFKDQRGTVMWASLSLASSKHLQTIATARGYTKASLWSRRAWKNCLHRWTSGQNLSRWGQFGTYTGEMPDGRWLEEKDKNHREIYSWWILMNFWPSCPVCWQADCLWTSSGQDL